MIVSKIVRIWLLKPVVSPALCTLPIFKVHPNKESGAGQCTDPQQAQDGTVARWVRRSFAGYI